MNTMTYKRYTARVEHDERDNILVGHLLGTQDIVSFHAENVAALREAFEEAVDDYLETCAKVGKVAEVLKDEAKEAGEGTWIGTKAAGAQQVITAPAPAGVFISTL